MANSRMKTNHKNIIQTPASVSSLSCPYLLSRAISDTWRGFCQHACKPCKLVLRNIILSEPAAAAINSASVSPTAVMRSTKILQSNRLQYTRLLHVFRMRVRWNKSTIKLVMRPQKSKHKCLYCLKLNDVASTSRVFHCQRSCAMNSIKIILLGRAWTGKLTGNLRHMQRQWAKVWKCFFQALLASDRCSYGIVESYNILPAKTLQKRSNYQSPPIKAINIQIWFAHVCTRNGAPLIAPAFCTVWPDM